MEARWEFDNGNESGEWRWLRIHPESQQLRCSEQSFRSLAECQQDAVRNGYVPAAGEVRRIERRRTPQQFSIPPAFERRRQQARAY